MIIYINKKDRIAISDRYINNKVGKHDYNGIENNLLTRYPISFSSWVVHYSFSIKQIQMMLCYLNFGSFKLGFETNKPLPKRIYVEFPLPYYMLGSIVKNSLLKNV